MVSQEPSWYLVENRLRGSLVATVLEKVVGKACLMLPPTTPDQGRGWFQMPPGKLPKWLQTSTQERQRADSSLPGSG